MAEKTREGEPTRRRWPDLFTLLTGIATLIVSSYILSDGRLWMPTVDPRWLITGGALLVGVLLLVSSLRGGRRKR